MKKYSLCFFLLFFFLFSRSQDYAYRHYNTSDGLVGNKVYQILEDKNHYLWFATESGVSRFDGSRFRNFTIEDGLPDNDILKIFEDSKGRIWMMPFANKICYYYKGKIFNEKNDSVLKKFDIKIFLNDMIEDKYGNLYFTENKSNLIVLTKDNKIIKYKGSKTRYYTKFGLKNTNMVVVFSNSYDSAAGFYQVLIDDDTINLKILDANNRFLIDKINYCLIYDGLRIWNDCHDSAVKSTYFNLFKTDGKVRKLKIPQGFNNFSIDDPNRIFLNTRYGSYSYDLNKNCYLDTFCINENISYTLRDFEGNLWLSSMDNGIFKVLSEAVQVMPNSANTRKGFFYTCIGGIKNKVFAGGSTGDVYKVSYGDTKLKCDWFSKTKDNDPIVKIKQLNGKMIVIDESHLFTINKEAIKVLPVNYSLTYSIKDITSDKYSNYYLATNVRLLRLSHKNKNISNVFYDRCNAVSVDDSIVFIGSNAGVNKIDSLGIVTYLGERFELMKEKVNCLLKAKYICVGTSNKGLLFFNGNDKLFQLNKEKGLSSNQILSVFFDGNFLWAGTSNGLNKIDISRYPFSVVKKITIDEGISGNQIKDIYVYDSIIYLITDNGLSVIEENKLMDNSKCNLPAIEVFVNGKKIDTVTKMFIINPDDNIKFDFGAISYKSEGAISYTYKIAGLDDNWNNTNLNSIFLPSLPNGKYELHLYATNKFGKKSNLIILSFMVQKRYYQSYWFIALCTLMVITISWFSFSIRQKMINNKQMENRVIEDKIASLKQDALKAQMNPHFIFNALNSIQHYIMDKDLRNANDFISTFASLIRAVLDNSTKKYITIEEEVSFLETYLKLEKMRFDNTFEYRIQVYEGIDQQEVCIPPMLIQPFIENAIIHGIRHRKQDGGTINVNFLLWGNFLVCIITDNGVGVKASSMYNTSIFKQHESKGIQNIKERVELLNKDIAAKISIKIEDLSTNLDNPSGTKVTLTLPVLHHV